MQTGLITVLHQPCIQITGNAVMAACVGTIGSDIYLYHEIALYVIIFCSRYAHGGIFGQDDNAAVVISHTDFVLRADHATTLHAAQFAFLDGKTFIAIIQPCTHQSHNNLLPGSHIGCTAHNLEWFAFSRIHAADVHVVAVGVRLTSQHMSRP